MKMRLKNKKIQGLLVEKNNHYQQAIDKLLAGETEEAKKHLEFYKTASEIIGEYKARRLFLSALAVGIFCMLLIVIMFTTTVYKTDVTLDILCTEMMFKKTEAWENESKFKGKSFYINRLRSIERNWGSDLETSDLELSGDPVTLKNLTFDSAAVIWARLSSGQLKFTGQSTSFSGKFALRSGEVSTGDADFHIEQPAGYPPSTFMFDSENPVYLDHRVELHVIGAVQWKLEGIKTDSMRFEENYPPGSASFRSTILEGAIKLEETGTDFEISEGQRLLVHVVNTDKFYLTEENSNLRFRFRGIVSTLNGYYKGVTKNLMPTWLEYLYKNERLFFIWSAILFIIGTIWSIRNVLFK